MAQYSYNPDWASAIASIESAGSGGYSALGAPNSRGSRAYGRYQVMDFNIPEWTERYVGKRLTPEEFLNSPEAQDAVFQGQFGSLVQRYGNERDAASAWFTGRPISAAGSDTDVHGRYTGASYADAFQKALGNPNVINAGIGSDALVALGKAPAAGQSQPGVLAAGAKPMAMMDTQPQGLLERMGLQRMDPNAQGETAMPFYQRPSFLDFAKGVGLGLSQLSTRPSQAAAQQLAQLQQDRSQRRAANQTLAWLASQPGGEMYVQMLQAGANPAAVLQAYMQAKQQAAALDRGEIKEVDNRLVRVMPDGTTQEIYNPYENGTLSPERLTIANTLRDDFRTDTADFIQTQNAYFNLVDAYEGALSGKGGVSDLQLVIGFAKVLDPGSVVRQEEAAAIRATSGLTDEIRAQLIGIINGTEQGSLGQDVRDQIMSLSLAKYKREAENAQNTYDTYATRAEQAGVPWEQIAFNREIAAIPVTIVPPMPANATIEGRPATTEEWRIIWSSLSQDERRKFMETGEL